MEFVLEPGITFDGYWIDYMIDTAKDLMKGELKEYFDNMPDTVKDGVTFHIADDVCMLMKNKLGSVISNKDYTQEDVIKTLNDFYHEFSTATCQAEFTGTNENGIFVLNTLQLWINYSVMIKIIMRDLDAIDTMKEYFELIIRHELGHFIDFISYHNRPIEEIMEIRDRMTDEKVKYYESWKGKEMTQELAIKYMELEEEAVANINGNVDPKRMAELDAIHVNKIKTHRTITINVEEKE